MVKAILGALFGCSHQRISFPLTPNSRRTVAGQVSTPGATYVVCLDCGREFAYDWALMRLGEPVRRRDPLATEVHTFVG